MKILLMPPVGVNQNLRYPYLGLGYLATALKKLSFEVNTFGFKSDQHTMDSFKDFLREFRPELVGLTIYTKDMLSAKETLEQIKQIAPEIFTVVGGPHPSGEPDGTLRDIPFADFAFQGEGEKGLPMLALALKEKKKDYHSIPGLVWRNKEVVIKNSLYFEDNLDNLGMPAWELMPPEEFSGASFNFFYKHPSIAPISVTRGCPYLCTYCAAWKSNGRRVRKRSVANVMEEITYLYYQHGVREIQIMDSNFTLDRKLVTSFCNELISSDLKISWSCPNGIRLDSINPELLRLMKKSGCYLLNVGIETGSQDIMTSIKKGLTVSAIEEKINMISQAGIFVVGFFMFGFPDEKMADIKKTLDFSFKLKLDGASYSIFTPLPGSEIYYEIISGKSDPEFNWNNFDFGHNTGYKYSVPFNDLKKIRTRAYLKFYLRPRPFFNLLRYSFSLKQIQMIFIFILRIFK